MFRNRPRPDTDPQGLTLLGNLSHHRCLTGGQESLAQQYDILLIRLRYEPWQRSPFPLGTHDLHFCTTTSIGQPERVRKKGTTTYQRSSHARFDSGTRRY